MRNRLKACLRQGVTTYGLWVTLESPSVTELAATLGLDWVCIDTEHGHLDFKEIIEHARAVRGSDTTLLVRVADIAQDLIKRALDIGAEGVFLPLIRSPADVRVGMRFAFYPPKGVRGVGGGRAQRWGFASQEYLSQANDEVMVIPIIETAEAVDSIESILDTPGIEAILFGPADLSASFGYLGAWEGPGVAERILAIKDLAAERGIAAGIVAQTVKDTVLRRDQGFRMITLGTDTSMMIRSVRESLAALRDQTAS